MGEHRTKAYVAVLLGLAVALSASWSYWYGLELEAKFALGALALAACVLVGDAFPIRISGRADIGVWDVALTVAVVALGPTWAALAALPAAFFVGRRDWLRTAYEVGHSVTIVYLAGMVFSFASTPLLLGKSGSTAEVVYGTLATGVSLQVANNVISAVLLKIKYDQGFAETWKELNQPYLMSDVVNILTAGLSVLALLTYGPVAALVVVGGSIGSQVLVYRSRAQVEENEELRKRVGSLEESLATSNQAFGTMIIHELGSKDGYTHRHAIATAVYAEDLAREMGMDPAHVAKLRMAGLLHNVGLFGLPEEILRATDRPNSVAQHRLAEHPARGEMALAAIPEFKEMAGWVRWHHERPDGRGFPDKLRESWIPTEAKILAVAQAYAALVLDGPSRRGVDPVEARKALGSGKDTEFDGLVVRAFLRILDTESEGYRMADDHRFVFPAPEVLEPTAPKAEDSSVGAEANSGPRRLLG